MAGQKINARDIIIEVDDGSGTSTWLEVDGLNSVTVNPSENEEATDTTTYSSQGNYEQEVMQRGATIEMEGFTLKDSTTGEPDPGQARVDELGTLMATESLGKIRFRHPIETDWKVWTATVTPGERGGENNDKTAWAATLTRSGASTTEAVV